MTQKIKLSKWCKKQGIHYSTGFRWFKDGLINGAYQTSSGSIFIEDEEEVKTKDNQKVFIYCRVSNQSRKAELEYQVDRCLKFAEIKGLTIEKVFKEVASGMNDNRKQFWLMIEQNPSIIIVENKDRLTRFGFEYIKRLLTGRCEIIVMNNENNDETDLIKDLVSIITSFCCRLYGLRRGYNKAKKIQQEIQKDD
jgi:predicted site-specific integrase-resolvase